jgi:hypothetical protein
MKRLLANVLLSVLVAITVVHAQDIKRSITGWLTTVPLTSAELATGITDETGSGLLVFNTSPAIANITPAANFTLTQNSVVPFTSVNAGAVANTVYLNAGNIGFGTTTMGRRYNFNNASALYVGFRRDDTETMVIGSDTSCNFLAYETAVLDYRLCIQATTGNVGIGTNNPTEQLTLIRTGFATFKGDGTTGRCDIARDTGGANWSKGKWSGGVLTVTTDADGVCN